MTSSGTRADAQQIVATMRDPVPDEPAGGSALAGEAEAFWQSAPELTAVRGWARARRAGPYALLGEILLQVTARVAPHVVLPPLGSYDRDSDSVQGAASLNQIIASVGVSGSSKGLAHALAADVVQWPGELAEPVYMPIGTGEGIAATFVASRRNEDKQFEVVRLAWSAVLSVTEVDKLAALLGRKNATLGGTLRQAWSGEALGEANASEQLRRYVPRGSYRLGFIIHVQPGRGGALLSEEEAAGGTPQRILWLPSSDPDIPATAPAPPGRIKWQPAETVKAAGRAVTALQEAADSDFCLPPVVLPVCETALSAIDQATVARHRGEAGALDGHALLVREKVAASLGFFLGTFGVTDREWELAGHLMDVSDATREKVKRALYQAAEQENESRGRSEAKRARIVRQAEESDAMAKASTRILVVLSGHSGWITHSSLRRTVGARHRDFFSDAIEQLQKENKIQSRKISHDTEGHGGDGTEYRASQ